VTLKLFAGDQPQAYSPHRRPQPVWEIKCPRRFLRSQANKIKGSGQDFDVNNNVNNKGDKKNCFFIPPGRMFHCESSSSDCGRHKRQRPAMASDNGRK